MDFLLFCLVLLFLLVGQVPANEIVQRLYHNSTIFHKSVIVSTKSWKGLELSVILCAGLRSKSLYFIRVCI